MLANMMLYNRETVCYNLIHGKPERIKAAYPPFFGGANPPDERKEGLPMITYSDLIQIGIFIVALVGLCYQIFRGKK